MTATPPPTTLTCRIKARIKNADARLQVCAEAVDSLDKKIAALASEAAKQAGAPVLVGGAS